MEKQETQERQRWSSSQHKLRLNSSQRYKDVHEIESRRSSSVNQGRATDSPGKKSSQLDRDMTVSGLVPEDLLEMSDGGGNDLFSPCERSTAIDRKSSRQAERIEVMEAWTGSPRMWAEKKRSGSIPTPLTSPRRIPQRVRDRHLVGGLSRRSSLVKSTTPGSDSRTVPFWIDRAGSSKVTDGPKHGSELQPSMSDRIERSHENGSQERRLSSFAGDRSQSRTGQTARSADGYDLPISLPKSQDSCHDSRLPGPDPIVNHADDNKITNQEFDPRNLSNEQRSDHTRPKSSNQDRNIGRSSDVDIETVSDKNNKIDEAGISSETHPCSNNNAGDRSGPQPQVPRSQTALIGASSVRDTAEEQMFSKTAEIKGAFDIIQFPIVTDNISQESSNSPGQVKNLAPQNQINNPRTAYTSSIMASKGLDSQRMPIGGDDVESPNPQPPSPRTENVKNSDPKSKSPENERIKSRETKPQSVEAKGTTNGTNPTQDQIEENVKPEAWFYNVRDSVDPVIISPTKTEEYERHHEAIARENAEKMEVFDGYKAQFQLKPTFDEEGKQRAAKKLEKANRKSRRRNPSLGSISTFSNDSSLIVSPGQCDGKSRSESELEQDGYQKARDEEENEAALHRIELYHTNYQLQRTLEAKEAKFKRDIKIAWTHRRPSPTSHEEHLDDVALEKIKSMEIFDEFGNQQRPIRTDPRWVTRETQINIMITRAQFQHVLEDYRQMYKHANRAAEAASKLEFAPLTARCCFYRGLAMYLHRDFSSAKDDFLKARGCAELYGISKESIERYIYLTDSAQDEETAILENFPLRKVSGAAGTSPRSPVHRDSSSFALGPPDHEKRFIGQVDEITNFRPDSPQRSNHIAKLPPPPNENPQMAAYGVLINPPQHEAVPEEIRKDIQEDKVRNINTASDPAEGNSQGRETVSQSSTANTERALIDSADPSSTEKHVTHAPGSPIMTSFTSPQAAPGAGYREEKDPDEMGPEKIYTYFGGRPQKHRGGNTSDLNPDSDFDSDLDPDSSSNTAK